jgi:hypothetical protein
MGITCKYETYIYVLQKKVRVHDHVGYPGIHVVCLPKIKYICIHKLKYSLVHMTRNIGAGHQSDDQQ